MNNKKIIICFLAVIMAIVAIIVISVVVIKVRKNENSYINYDGVEIVSEPMDEFTPDENVSNSTNTSTVVVLDDEVLSQY